MCKKIPHRHMFILQAHIKQHLTCWALTFTLNVSAVVCPTSGSTSWAFNCNFSCFNFKPTRTRSPESAPLETVTATELTWQQTRLHDNGANSIHRMKAVWGGWIITWWIHTQSHSEFKLKTNKHDFLMFFMFICLFVTFAGGSAARPDTRRFTRVLASPNLYTRGGERKVSTTHRTTGEF